MPNDSIDFQAGPVLARAAQGGGAGGPPQQPHQRTRDAQGTNERRALSLGER
jgi:hypothetical protein